MPDAPPLLREELLEHLALIRGWCFLKTHDAHLADDVAQETILAALKRIDSVRDPAHVRGFLFRIAQRRLADESRRRRHEVPFPEDLIDRACPGPPPGAVSPTEAQARRAIRRLPAFLRRPVRLHYLQGRPLREVAEELATTVNAVKARLYRARRLLRAEVDP